MAPHGADGQKQNKLWAWSLTHILPRQGLVQSLKKKVPQPLTHQQTGRSGGKTADQMLFSFVVICCAPICGSLLEGDMEAISPRVNKSVGSTAVRARSGKKTLFFQS